MGRCREALRAHVDAGAEGSGAVGRRAGASLHLYVLERAGQVGRVDPVEHIALGLVHGDVVVGHVDAGAVGAAHAQTRVAHAAASVAGGDHAWRGREQEGQVEAMVQFLDELLVYIGVCHRSSGGGTCCSHLHLLQVTHLGGVAAGNGACRGDQAGAGQGDSRHDLLFHYLLLISFTIGPPVHLMWRWPRARGDPLSSLRRHCPVQILWV